MNRRCKTRVRARFRRHRRRGTGPEHSLLVASGGWIRRGREIACGTPSGRFMDSWGVCTTRRIAPSGASGCVRLCLFFKIFWYNGQFSWWIQIDWKIHKGLMYLDGLPARGCCLCSSCYRRCGHCHWMAISVAGRFRRRAASSGCPRENGVESRSDPVRIRCVLFHRWMGNLPAFNSINNIHFTWFKHFRRSVPSIFAFLFYDESTIFAWVFLLVNVTGWCRIEFFFSTNTLSTAAGHFSTRYVKLPMARTILILTCKLVILFFIAWDWLNQPDEALSCR